MQQNTAMLEKISNFVALRYTKQCNARTILKILKFYDLWPSSLHSLQSFSIFRIVLIIAVFGARHASKFQYF